jgi:transposase-like protein
MTERPGDDELREMYHSGMSMDNIAEKLGVSSGSTVHKWLKAAGVETREQARPLKYTDDDLCETLAEVARGLGEAPTMAEFEEATGAAPSPQTVRMRLGSWTRARRVAAELAGVPDEPLALSEDELVADVARVMSEVDPPFYKKHYRQLGKHSPNTVAHRIGWDEAKRRAREEL